MTYAVKEIYYTLQGEGAQAGRPAVFLRFAGCNLWSGLERDRESAVCTFCDTDFIGTNGPGGGKFKTASALVDAVKSEWPKESTRGQPYVICTGGEPLLQLDKPLIDAFHAEGFEVGVETNGTIEAPAGLDWICVSPKSTAPLVQRTGSELKLVYRQKDALPEKFEDLAFDFFYLQPMDGASRVAETAAAIEYCRTHPQWRLSLQTHKLVGIP
ncbi:7-carboxy-7-deazaguanine synthase [Hyphococcus lacteus]|uniref:7-carboxy-7-deazaguanine synthase n=1 Tax=Hyphococcus lacteus TaxID=3143536 RepID=A0ABV3Z4Y1_9PROT